MTTEPVSELKIYYRLLLFELVDKEFMEFIECFSLKHAMMSCQVSRFVNIESSTLKRETWSFFKVASTSRYPVN